MNKNIAIVSCIAMAVVLGVGIFFGARAIYDNGISTGRQIESDEIVNELKNLGTAISEKANFQQSISEVFKDLPAEVNAEGIDAYIAKLEEYTSNINTESVKNTLIEYLSKWKEFKDTYGSQDNDKITEAFNTLKTTASETATQIKTSYDEAIKNAVNNL